jgi:hypothetical protein
VSAPETRRGRSGEYPIKLTAGEDAADIDQEMHNLLEALL